MEEMRVTLSVLDENQRINFLYSKINYDPDYLQAFDQKQFSNTPLHLAAGEGMTLLALEIQRLMPSFGKKLNPDGYSPIHLALLRGRIETVRAMIRLNPELISVQSREGITPLHYAAEMDDGVDILVEFLVGCPESVDVLTVREETAVHVAVKSEKLASFEVLVGWLRRKGKSAVLGWPDFEGNTALHLAAPTNQLPEVMSVLGDWVDVNAKNYAGLTTRDIVMRDNQNAVSAMPRRAKIGSSITPTPPLAHYFSPILSFLDAIGAFADYLDTGIAHEMRSVGLVVSALIATAAYQGVLRSPGLLTNQTPLISFNITNTTSYSPAVGWDVLGSYQSHNISIAQWIGIESTAIFFVIPNCLALGASLAMVSLLLPSRLSFTFIQFSLVCLVVSTGFMLILMSNTQALDTSFGAIILIGVVFLIKVKAVSLRQKLILMKRLKVRDPA